MASVRRHRDATPPPWIYDEPIAFTSPLRRTPNLNTPFDQHTTNFWLVYAVANCKIACSLLEISWALRRRKYYYYQRKVEGVHRREIIIGSFGWEITGVLVWWEFKFVFESSRSWGGSIFGHELFWGFVRGPRETTDILNRLNSAWGRDPVPPGKSGCGARTHDRTTTTQNWTCFFFRFWRPLLFFFARNSLVCFNKIIFIV